MKTLPRFSLLLLLSFLPGLAADVVAEREPLTPHQLEELVSPIALYPDPLIALILPASTFPSDVVLAARFLEDGGAPERASTEPWDDSVQALARYREVIDYLDDNLAWTRRLGHLFLDQPNAVMDAIQRVRARARTAGLLGDTPEQQVIVETEEIRIVPAQPTVIYVPRYDPEILYYSSTPVYYGYSRPFITFGIGWGIGTWLNFDCDWRSRSVHIVHRPAYWYHTPDWRHRHRHTGFGSTHWTRRTPYPHHDRRFDRSPRSAGYDVRGASHRHASEPRRFADRSRDDHRRDYNRMASDSPAKRPSASENRRRSEPRGLQADDSNRIATPSSPSVTAVTPAAERPERIRRRPDAGTQPGIERRPSPARSASEHRSQPSLRPAPPRSESAAAPETLNRSRRSEQQQQPPPARRAEAQDRAEQRRQSDGQEQRSSGRSTDSSRGSRRDNLQR
jgi:hypothetical protein